MFADYVCIGSVSRDSALDCNSQLAVGIPVSTVIPSKNNAYQRNATLNSYKPRVFAEDSLWATSIWPSQRHCGFTQHCGVALLWTESNSPDSWPLRTRSENWTLWKFLSLSKSLWTLWSHISALHLSPPQEHIHAYLFWLFPSALQNLPSAAPNA